MAEVWQVETGEYEQRHTMFVVDSPEVAEKRIHETYPPPFEVAWEPMKDTSWDGGGKHYPEFTVVGHFAGVPGYSIEHTADFTIGTLEYVKEELLVSAAPVIINNWRELEDPLEADGA